MAKLDTKIRKQMEAAGWKMRSGKTHFKWYCGCGAHGPIIQATSIGKGRGAQNFKSLMKRQGCCSVCIKLG